MSGSIPTRVLSADHRIREATAALDALQAELAHAKEIAAGKVERSAYDGKPIGPEARHPFALGYLESAVGTALYKLRRLTIELAPLCALCSRRRKHAERYTAVDDRPACDRCATKAAAVGATTAEVADAE